MTYQTHSEQETLALASRLAPMLAAGDAVLLEGDLGAGKSVFARGIARGMGVEGPMPFFIIYYLGINFFFSF